MRKTSPYSNIPQNGALGNKPFKLCSYFPAPCTQVYCFRLRFLHLIFIYFFIGLFPRLMNFNYQKNNNFETLILYDLYGPSTLETTKWREM